MPGSLARRAGRRKKIRTFAFYRLRTFVDVDYAFSEDFENKWLQCAPSQPSSTLDLGKGPIEMRLTPS